MNRAVRAFLGGLAAIALASEASAADRVPLDEIPRLPAVRDAIAGKPGVAGVSTAQRSPIKGKSYYEVKAATASGYCLVSSTAPGGGLSLESSTYSDILDHELWRFTPQGSTATVERVRFEIDGEQGIWEKSRTTLALHAIARARGVDVFALRDPSGDVYLLASHAAGGREQAFDGEGGWGARFLSSSCGWGAARLPVRLLKSGVVARLQGETETPTNASFIIDGSLAMFGRAAEPVVAVRVRLL